MAKETKEITPAQYAKYLGCGAKNVLKHLRATGLKNLPDVKSVKRYSRFYLFVVDAKLRIETAKK